MQIYGNLINGFSYLALGVLLLTLIFVLGVGLLASVRQSRRFRIGHGIVFAVFALAMLHSMATKPDRSGSSPRARAAAHDADDLVGDGSASVTNAAPRPEGFAISGFVKTPSNILVETSWPFGLFPSNSTLDCFVAFPTLTNDWQWIKSVPVSVDETNVIAEVTLDDLPGCTNFPSALFLKVEGNAPETVDPNDADGDGLSNELEPFVAPVECESGVFVEGELLTNLSAEVAFTSTGHTACVDFVFPEPIEMGGSSYERMSLDRNGIVYLRPSNSLDVIASCEFPDDLAQVLSRVNDCVLMPYWSRLVCSTADPDCQVRIERTNDIYVVTYQNMRFDPSGVMDQVPAMLQSLVPMLVNQMPISFQVIIDPVHSSVSYGYRLGENRNGLLDGLTTGKLAGVGYQGRFAATHGIYSFGEEALSSAVRIVNRISSGTDPALADTDGDGTNDGNELRNGRNPLDPTDAEGSDEASVIFVFGDPSWTHSESYRVVIAPVEGSGEGSAPETRTVVSPCGRLNVVSLPLAKGWKYSVRLQHAGTTLDPPDYDYVNAFATVSGDVLIEDPQGLSSCHVIEHSTGEFPAGGKTAYISVFDAKVVFCKPEDENWGELEYSRVLLDDEAMRVKVCVWPQTVSIEACRRFLGESVTVCTMGTNPDGVAIPVDWFSLVAVGNRTEFRMQKSRNELIALGLLPEQDEDGILEMSCLDMGDANPTSDSNLTDSRAFMGLGYEFRGDANSSVAKGLGQNPPVSNLSVSFFQAAGSEVLKATCSKFKAEERQIMNQADYFYYSGHGHHNSGMAGDFMPSDVSDYWKRDLDCVIFAGCSVLDVNDYNNNFLNPNGVWDPEDHAASPGRLWENKGPNILLGYNYTAPTDSTHAPERIIRSWLNLRQTMDDVDAWMMANNNMNGRNACAIVKNVKYVYFKRTRRKFFSTYTRVESRKENW